MRKIFKKALEHKGGLCGITRGVCSVGNPNIDSNSKIEGHREIRRLAEEKIEKQEMEKSNEKVSKL